MFIHKNANQWLTEWMHGLLSHNMWPLWANSIYLCMYLLIALGHKNSACALNKHDHLISALLYHAPGHDTGFFVWF